MRQLKEKKRERLMRVAYLRLIENAMVNKKQRMIEEAAWQFRRERLSDKVMRILKRRWLKRKRDRLMMQVADDFNMQKEQKR
jgi:hypothetical protein